MPVSVRDVLQQNRAIFGSVPAAGQPFVCPRCLGPLAASDAQCYACGRLYSGVHAITGRPGYHRVPATLHNSVVPMTSVLNKSIWYSKLWNYKRGETNFWPVIAALVHTYLEQNRGHIEGLLGGTITRLAVVPSKRGFTYDTQPLVKAVALVESLADLLVRLVDFVPGARLGRWEYNPAAFSASAPEAAGERVVLLEDAWITGATAVSAAGRLLEAGADAVVILPLARAVDVEFWPELHPYRQAMKTPYDPSAWPR